MSAPVDPAERRARLLRVLALSARARPDAIRAASDRLRAWLETRRARLAETSSEDHAAVAREIAELVAETERLAPRSDAAPSAQAPSLFRQFGAAIALVAAVALLALLVVHAAGYRITRTAPVEPPPLYVAPAEVVLEGELGEATLRVLDADRSELLEKLPAQGAHLELESGRYALEVSRADCPDAWTRSVFLESGRLHRYEPEICAGHGHLVVQAKPRGDRLRIDGKDVGEADDRPHRLGVGEHRVRIDKAGVRPFEATVRIRADETIELKADLLASAGGAPTNYPLPVERPAANVSPADVAALRAFTTSELKPDLKPAKIELADLGMPKRGDFLAREGMPAMPDGGSTAWHDRVVTQLRERFDRDGSGAIDRLDESEAIPCTVWLEIERDFDRGGLGLSLAHYYGFDGSEWHPGALAVTRSIRSGVYARMRECGVAP